MDGLLDFVHSNIDNGQLEIASVNGRNYENATKIDKKAFIEKNQRTQKINKIAEFLKDLNWNDKFEWVHQKKLKGNRMIKKNKIEEAKETYMEAMLGLELNSGTAEQNERVKNELQIPLILNLGVCFFKTSNYNKSVELFTQGIKLNPNHTKLYCKRGYAYGKLGNYEKAMIDFNKALSFSVDEIEKETILECLKNMNKDREKERELYQKCLKINNNQNADNTKTAETDESEESEELLKYNDDWEETEKYKLLRYLVYPAKKGYTYFSGMLSCCRRKYNNEDLLK